MEGTLLAADDPSAQKVIRGFGERDRAAFTAMVARYQPDLLRVCYVILGDASLAEDAAQSAWIQAWRKLDQLRDAQKLRSWLVAVAANEARQIARRRRPVPGSADAIPWDDADPRLADLTAALARLTVDERRLLSLRYVAELSSDEIGKAIGASAEAVRHRLARLLARLREDLG